MNHGFGSTLLCQKCVLFCAVTADLSGSVLFLGVVVITTGLTVGQFKRKF